MEKRYEVAWIEAMPNCTENKCLELSLYLHLLPLFIIFIFLWVVNVLVYVPFQSPLNAYVPSVSFHLEIGFKVEIGNVVDLNSSEVMNYFSLFIFHTFFRVIGKS